MHCDRNSAVLVDRHLAEDWQMDQAAYTRRAFDRIAEVEARRQEVRELIRPLEQMCGPHEPRQK